MGLFRKKGQEVLDLTELRDRGILQRSREIADREKIHSVNENKVIDLGDAPSVKNNDFGFLDNLASAGINNERTRGEGIEHLKIKIEDIEYKLERLIERLEKIEEKFKDS